MSLEIFSTDRCNDVGRLIIQNAILLRERELLK